MSDPWNALAPDPVPTPAQAPTPPPSQAPISAQASQPNLQGNNSYQPPAPYQPPSPIKPGVGGNLLDNQAVRDSLVFGHDATVGANIGIRQYPDILTGVTHALGGPITPTHYARDYAQANPVTNQFASDVGKGFGVGGPLAFIPQARLATQGGIGAVMGGLQSFQQQQESGQPVNPGQVAADAALSGAASLGVGAAFKYGLPALKQYLGTLPNNIMSRLMPALHDPIPPVLKGHVEMGTESALQAGGKSLQTAPGGLPQTGEQPPTMRHPTVQEKPPEMAAAPPKAPFRYRRGLRGTERNKSSLHYEDVVDTLKHLPEKTRTAYKKMLEEIADKAHEKAQAEANHAGYAQAFYKMFGKDNVENFKAGAKHGGKIVSERKGFKLGAKYLVEEHNRSYPKPLQDKLAAARAKLVEKQEKTLGGQSHEGIDMSGLDELAGKEPGALGIRTLRGGIYKPALKYQPHIDLKGAAQIMHEAEEAVKKTGEELKTARNEYLKPMKELHKELKTNGTKLENDRFHLFVPVSNPRDKMISTGPFEKTFEKYLGVELSHNPSEGTKLIGNWKRIFDRFSNREITNAKEYKESVSYKWLRLDAKNRMAALLGGAAMSFDNESQAKGHKKDDYEEKDPFKRVFNGVVITAIAAFAFHKGPKAVKDLLTNEGRLIWHKILYDDFQGLSSLMDSKLGLVKDGVNRGLNQAWRKTNAALLKASISAKWDSALHASLAQKAMDIVSRGERPEDKGEEMLKQAKDYLSKLPDHQKQALLLRGRALKSFHQFTGRYIDAIVAFQNKKETTESQKLLANELKSICYGLINNVPTTGSSLWDHVIAHISTQFTRTWFGGFGETLGGKLLGKVGSIGLNTANLTDANVNGALTVGAGYIVKAQGALSPSLKGYNPFADPEVQQAMSKVILGGVRTQEVMDLIATEGFKIGDLSYGKGAIPLDAEVQNSLVALHASAHSYFDSHPEQMKNLGIKEGRDFLLKYLNGKLDPATEMDFAAGQLALDMYRVAGWQGVSVGFGLVSRGFKNNVVRFFVAPLERTAANFHNAAGASAKEIITAVASRQIALKNTAKLAMFFLTLQQLGGEAGIPEILKEIGYDLDKDDTAKLVDFANHYSIAKALGINLTHWMSNDPFFPSMYAVANPAAHAPDALKNALDGLTDMFKSDNARIVMDASLGDKDAATQLHKKMTALKALSLTPIGPYPGGVPLGMTLDAAEIGILAHGGKYRMVWKDPATGKPLGSELRSLDDDKVNVFDVLHHALHFWDSERLAKLNQAHWEEKNLENPGLTMQKVINSR